MATSSIHNGWHYDPSNSRLDLYYRGTRAGDITASGLNITGATTHVGTSTWTTSADSAAVADEVSIGAYELSAGNRALAWSQEAAVVASVTEADYSHSVPIRINGTTYNIMLAATLS